MERISFLNARKWDGSWVQLCGPEVSIDKQRERFYNEFKPLLEHPEYNVILMFQTKGGQEFWHFIHKRSEKKKAK